MNESEPNKPVPETPKCPQCGTALPAGALGGLCPACLLKQGTSADTVSQPETAPFVPPPVAEIAKLFPQLEIIRLLGKGGMGAVYLARQPGLDRMVALKILPPQSDADSGFAERFTREARALARLSHPNIVMVHEFGVAGNLHYFIMEFVDGVNLRQLQLSGRLSPHEALQIVPQLCDALQYAHDEGVVHRDIKPENVLMDRRGRVKIADFGLAKMLGQDATNLRLTGEGHVMGTPHYMSPEQVEHPLDVDHRADIYSLGVVFYEMLTGELPIGRFAPPSSKVQIDVRLDDVVMRTLEKEPNRRYQHVSQIKTAVDTITNSAAPPPAANAENLGHEILARDYVLNIGSCVSRGWELVKSDFFPLVGLTALILILVSVASSFGSTVVKSGDDRTITVSSVLGMLVWGPLIGGLCLHYLKKIRREVTGVDTAFSGFSKRFLHLFLGGFVAIMLTMIGFIFLVVPGIYLLVAWVFTLPLIIDKQIDFWPAMELSRKVVTRHWWKFLGLGLVLGLVLLAGAMACGFGILVAVPVAIAALMYAYEDIFGGSQLGAKVHPVTVGPAGTMVMPNAPAKPAAAPAAPAAGTVKPPVIGAALVLLLGFAAHAENNILPPATQPVFSNSIAVTSWSPSFVNGEKPDPEAVLQEAVELAGNGSYEAALQRHVWFFNHALDYNHWLVNTRRSELAAWNELGRKYPAARQALLNTRDHAARDLTEGRGYFSAFMDLAAINEELDDDDSTVAVFKSLPTNNPILSQQCFPLVESLLVKQGAYALCISYIPDSRAAFAVLRMAWKHQKVWESQLGQIAHYDHRNNGENDFLVISEPKRTHRAPIVPARIVKTADEVLSTQAQLLIEILIANGRTAEAEEIRDEAIALLNKSGFKPVAANVEQRTGNET